MKTESFKLTLPGALRPLVEQQAQGAGCKSPADYIETLILAEHQRQEDQRIERLLLEAVNSPSSPLTDEELDEVYEKAMKRLDESSKLQ